MRLSALAAPWDFLAAGLGLHSVTRLTASVDTAGVGTIDRLSTRPEVSTGAIGLFGGHFAGCMGTTLDVLAGLVLPPR